MNNTMINAVGFPAKEYDDEVTGKGVILAEVMITVKDKEVAQGMLELFRLGVERSDDMKKIEAYAREEESKKKMDAAQVTGSASSYARKYALNSLFLLDDSKDADTDEYKRNEVIAEKEAKRLYDLMQKKGNDGSSN